MLNSLQDIFYGFHTILFEEWVLPFIHLIGLGRYIDDAYVGTEWLLLGCLQIIVIAFILRPLEKLFPVQTITDSTQVFIDVIYTFIHRLGILRLGLFFLLDPIIDGLDSQLRFIGFSRTNFEDLWPLLHDWPLLSFLLYLIVLDGFDYIWHRSSHRFNMWWELHAVHHSQRQLTAWSDNRSHLLDDVLRDFVLALLALLIGVEPSQFVWLVAVSQMIQSLQHANIKVEFGWLGERLLISPRFHRTHHAIGLGFDFPGRPGVLGGCNFGVLFPWWDMLLGTAQFEKEWHLPGIHDQLPEPEGRGLNYGDGFWVQQTLAFKRIMSHTSNLFAR
jgi:sterol desaturase/sphingolipid hydroxylase (fatty acid hydroxylase superfamily)